MSRLQRRLCNLELQAATRGAALSTVNQNTMARKALDEYLAAAERAELEGWLPDTPEEERGRMVVYERLLEESRRR
jgi:hypothetical protein